MENLNKQHELRPEKDWNLDYLFERFIASKCK